MASPSKGSSTTLKNGDLIPSSAPDIAGSPPPNPSHKEAFLSPSRVATITAAAKWIDKYLGHKCGPDLYKPNINYASSLGDMTYKSIEQDNVIRFIEEFALWFACNTLPVANRQDKDLKASAKYTYFKATKQVLLRQFPHHPLLLSPEDGWWHHLIGSFSKLANRTTMLDPAQSNDPSALPLYRDITTQDIGIGHGQSPNDANRLVRAKDRG